MSNFLPSDFMDRVVAWPGPDGLGYVNAHWQPPDGRGGGMRGKPFKELNEFMNFVQYAATKPGTYKEIYFCLSTQKTTGRIVHGHATAYRNASQAMLLKALWLDVDVKPEKGYATVAEAIDAIFAFQVAAGLPVPSALVKSGGGVHVYWISDAPLTVDQWRPFAEGLKAEALRLGLKCDAGITADSVRVLRVPGTFNNKLATPRAVKLLRLDASYNFFNEPSLMALATIGAVSVKPTKVTAAVTKPHFDLTGWAPMAPAFAAQLSPNDVLAAGMNSRSDLPLKIDEVIRNCVHFQDCAATEGKAHSEPLWQLTLLASTFFEDDRKLAHIFGRKHPGYTPESTDAKYDQKLQQKAAGNLGWPGCKAFEDAGAKCKTCPFYKKLNSPLNLAERAAPPVVTYQGPPPPADVYDLEYELPEGYVLNPQGWICEQVVKTLSNGTTVDEMRPLFMCKLRGFDPLAGAARCMKFETELDKGHWGAASIDESIDLVTEQSLIKALRRDGVKPFVDNQRRIAQFMTSFMSKIDAARERQRTIAFGWLYPPNDLTEQQKPIGFAYGGRVVMADGSERASGFSDKQIESYYKPRGNIDPWHTALKMVTDQHHPALELITLASFGAPLMRFTGEHNGVFCAWSPESGAHKSTSIAIGAAVWANPKLAKERVSSSQKGIMRRLGYLRNLPVYWDEINKDEKMAEIVAILGELTEGGGGAKLRQDRSLYEIEEWQTLMLVGSNMSLTNAILRDVKNTDAPLQRTFEYEVDPRPDTADQHTVSVMIDSLNYNFGHMGLLYSHYIATHIDEIETLINSTMVKFSQDVGATSPERFRKAIAVASYVGGTIANKLGCNFNLEEVWNFLIARFREQRGIIQASAVVAGTAMNTLALMTQFLKECTRNTLWVNSVPMKRAGKPEAVAYIAGPNREHPDPVHIRFAVQDRTMQVSMNQFERFLHRLKMPGRAVYDSLEGHYNATKERISLNLGVGVLGGKETVFTIPVPTGSPWENDLFVHTPIDQRPVTPATAPVTAAVTDPMQALADMRATTGLESGMAQAAADLKKVTDQ